MGLFPKVTGTVQFGLDTAPLLPLPLCGILIICLSAIYAGSIDSEPERWEVSQSMIEAEIKKARKAEHAGEKFGPKRKNGFQGV